MDYFPIQGYYESNEHYYIEGKSYRYNKDTNQMTYGMLIKRKHTSEGLQYPNRQREFEIAIKRRIDYLYEEAANETMEIAKFKAMLCGNPVKDSYYLGRIVPYQKRLDAINKELDEYTLSIITKCSAITLLGIRRFRKTSLNVQPIEIIVKIVHLIYDFSRNCT
jgi:hypothetical protein